MGFYPEGASVPQELRRAEFVLQPLSTRHVELDYAALMDSKDMLRRWSQSDWPSDDFTLQENWQDLDRHEREHHARKAFTYTVLNPDESTCLGCVYIHPLYGPLSDSDHEAEVRFWVRQPRLVDDLDHRLLQALIDWFREDWAFQKFYFVTVDADERQVEVLEASGLERKLAYPGKGTVLYLYYG
ncbi:MAG: GNAT family N-acetyltransferase [Chloroflexia bacterium]|nr:GNAT family N-acetyltransferase [Chloroflexia bacterium]